MQFVVLSLCALSFSALTATNTAAAEFSGYGLDSIASSGFYTSDDLGAALRSLQQSSADDTPQICLEEPETGPCKASITRFFFNPASGECERFVYGGCQGNANNFRTKEECESVCIDPSAGATEENEGADSNDEGTADSDAASAGSSSFDSSLVPPHSNDNFGSSDDAEGSTSTGSNNSKDQQQGAGDEPDSVSDGNDSSSQGKDQENGSTGGQQEHTQSAGADVTASAGALTALLVSIIFPLPLYL